MESFLPRLASSTAPTASQASTGFVSPLPLPARRKLGQLLNNRTRSKGISGGLSTDGDSFSSNPEKGHLLHCQACDRRACDCGIFTTAVSQCLASAMVPLFARPIDHKVGQKAHGPSQVGRLSASSFSRARHALVRSCTQTLMQSPQNHTGTTIVRSRHQEQRRHREG